MGICGRSDGRSTVPFRARCYAPFFHSELIPTALTFASRVTDGADSTGHLLVIYILCSRFLFELRLYLLFTLFSETCKVKTTRSQGQDSVILYSSWLYK